MTFFCSFAEFEDIRRNDARVLEGGAVRETEHAPRQEDASAAEDATKHESNLKLSRDARAVPVVTLFLLNHQEKVNALVNKFLQRTLCHKERRP